MTIDATGPGPWIWEDLALQAQVVGSFSPQLIEHLVMRYRDQYVDGQLDVDEFEARIEWALELNSRGPS